MSRFTASPFHKPSPFEFPHGPLSPPDTNAEVVGPARMPTPSVAGGHDNRHADVASTAVPSVNLETPGARFRRVSSIAYHNSGIRESRERTPQRSSIKSFIVVIPPASLIQEHGQLGHILNSGPHDRLSQGIIMPLFPTMYGQLSAIAREFNFPSTAGLCLYLQLTEEGITMTPRISEDSWQLVWSHTLDPPSPSTSRGPPLGGKIEFDIDYRQARWYSSWISSLHREHLEISMPVYPSASLSMAHHRGESRTTVADTFDDDQVTDNNSVAPPRHSAPPLTRHVPRKLSLVDRFDVASARTDSRPASRSALSPPEQQPITPQILSPIVQEDEPKSARHVLDNKVRSWRASAVLKPTHLATTGQVSLEPANMPNNVSIADDTESPTESPTADKELDFEDFDWSVTSAGPEDYDPLSPMSWDRVPSVHLANRLEGSVCLTPSDCTSFGPSDYTLPSPVPSFGRLPSPDIAYRMFEDSPPTPTTATSWGAPSSYPPSPLSNYRAPSVDIGERMVFSRPVTPLTATSWGPSDRSWPSSPVSEYDSRSIHLADRGEISRPVTPSTATSWGAPLSYPPSPSEPFYVQTPDAGHRGFEDCDEMDLQRWGGRPWGHAWPYNRSVSEEQPIASQSQALGEEIVLHLPWEHVWPYNQVHDASADHAEEEHGYSARNRATKTISPLTLNHPWNHVWPYNRSIIVEVEVPITVQAPSCYPYLNIYPSVYPHLEIYPSIQYGIVDRETSVYPEFNLYPEVKRKVALHEPSPSQLPAIVVMIAPAYPTFNIYPAVYPGNMNELYPPIVPTNYTAITVRLPQAYPSFDLYPSIYPYVEPYPPILGEMIVASSKAAGMHSQQGPRKIINEFNLSVHANRYPTFNLYPAVYPNFDIYPAVGSKYPSHCGLPDSKSASVHLPSSYPVFNIYPAIYPIFEIYPSLPADYAISKKDDVPMKGYPVVPSNIKQMETKAMVSRSFNLEVDMHGAIYPNFELYPPVSSVREECIGSLSSLVMQYPVFNLYPAVYPYFDLYPSMSGQIEGSRQLTVCKPVQYPMFNIYPAVYPHFDLYPLIPGETEALKLLTVCKTVEYPVFNLYPAIYPYFDLYPAASGQTGPSRIITVCEPVHYPFFQLYPPVYPHFDLYPVISAESEDSKLVIVKLGARYPSFDLYPAVYPYFNLWPSVCEPLISSIPKPAVASLRIKSRLTHSELHAMVLMERLASGIAFSQSRKSHNDIHMEVFQDGTVDTPSGNYSERLAERRVRPRRDTLSHLSGVDSPPRSLSFRPSLQSSAPNPSSRPVPPATGAGQLSGFEMITPLVPEEEPPRTRIPPVRRSSLASRTASRSYGNADRQYLSAVEERSDHFIPPSLNRSSSMVEQNGRIRRPPSIPLPATPTSGRRDSMVLQRVRAYNTGDDSSLSAETLSKFPMPPRAPLPPLPKAPKALDRSKYPFA